MQEMEQEISPTMVMNLVPLQCIAKLDKSLIRD